MNMLLTARQLERLRDLPPGHEVFTARDGSPMLEPAPPVERVRSYLRVGE